MADFEVRDLKELQRKCEQTVQSLSENNILAKIAMLIQRQAKRNWGHGTHAGGFPNIQTDRLRSSIMTEVSPDGKEAYVGTNVQYAVPLEFGHKQEVGRYIPIQGFRALNASVYPTGFSGRRRRAYEKIGGFRLVKPYAPAYPFLGPAVDSVMASGEADGVLANFGTDLEKDWGK